VDPTARAIPAPLEQAVQVKFPIEDRGSSDDGFASYRHLAVHVLARALKDLLNPAGSPTDRESARLFLTGSPMLSHWCRVAALDPRWVAERAVQLTSR